MQAMNAAGQGRRDEALALLQSALSRDAVADAEVLGDMAAIELRAGNLVEAIAIARHVIAAAPQHDAARLTLALSLTAIGSNIEALMLLDELNEGVHSERFRQALPELATLATAEGARLRSLGVAVASVADAAPAAHFGTASDPGPCDVDSLRSASMTGHKYDFSHLVQPLDQNVGGPIQDDEALMLYAIVRTMRVKRVLEIGGLSGYSARNFLRALSWDADTAVYTVDLNPVKSQAPNHYTLCKDVALLEAADVHGQPLDLIFFDAHVYDAQMDMYVLLVNKGLINDDTIIALHDTNLHPKKSAPWSYPIRDVDGVCGYVHQDVERRMVNTLRKDFGYDAFCAHTDVRRNDARLPFRHGLTVMKKFVELRT
jgi:predicted O-methyltransferase YrrM